MRRDFYPDQDGHNREGACILGDSTSGPVHIVVTEAALPVVSIFASDPIAYTGTNSMGGTNTASFLVRRTGPTNADLVVSYALSGSASNGVDYVKLPGSVTIPAGSATASIKVEPLKSPDLSSNRVQTVVATLQPPAVAQGSTPSYLVGRPQEAEALIVDRLALSSGRLGDGSFHAVLPAPEATPYQSGSCQWPWGCEGCACPAERLFKSSICFRIASGLGETFSSNSRFRIASGSRPSRSSRRAR